MAMQALAAAGKTYLAPDYAVCYAACGDKLDYQDLIVTKCMHVFCRTCLEECLRDKPVCPLHNFTALSPITTSNVRQRDEDPKIEGKDLNGMQYTAFKLHLERFTYYIKNDFSALQDKLAAEKVVAKISSCELLKADKASKKAGPNGPQEDLCAICLKNFPRMYFIIQDDDPTRVGRFMHDDCWQKTVDEKSDILEISAPDMVKVAEQLHPPRALPPEPFKPPSPMKVFFLAIILPMSIWALATNSRVYYNKSFVLYVLSIPALLIFKVSSLLWSGLKAVFTAKHVK